MATPIHKSTTTQNVAIAGASGAGSVAGVLLLLRTNWPDLLPWGPEADAGIIALVTTVVVPVLSRVIAFLRHPQKMGWRP